MYPHERSLVEKLADKPFAIIGVNSDRDLEAIRDTVKEKNISWRSFQNEQQDGQISDAWKVNSWPSIYIIDTQGVIRYKDVRGDAIDEALTELLKEAGHEVDLSH